MQRFKSISNEKLVEEFGLMISRLSRRMIENKELTIEAVRKSCLRS